MKKAHVVVGRLILFQLAAWKKELDPEQLDISAKELKDALTDYETKLEELVRIAPEEKGGKKRGATRKKAGKGWRR